MPFMANEIPWLDYIKKHNDENIFAYMTDKHSNLHTYSVQHRGKIASNHRDNCFYRCYIIRFPF